MQFIDKARIFIKAGNGGNGCAAFHREKYVMKGGPSGGDGGRGGSIVFVADPQQSTLLDFKRYRHFRAQDGQPGRAELQAGANGEDLLIKVPVGTIVRDLETGSIVADMSEPGKRRTVLYGGRGGKGNAQAQAQLSSPKEGITSGTIPPAHACSQDISCRNLR